MSRNEIETNGLETEDFDALRDARALLRRGDPAAACAAFEAAVAARPGNLRALVEAARALGGAYQIGRALALLEAATARAGGDPQVLTQIAASYGRIHREGRAIAALEALTPRPAAARAELAALYERVNRLDDAVSEIDACLATAPQAGPLWLAKGRILRRRGDAAAAEQALRRALALSAEPALVAEGWTELCYLADAAGDHAAAVAAIERAHGVLRRLPDTPRLLAQARANNRAIAALAHEADGATLQDWRARRVDDDPRAARAAHLIGFPRSGTTLLEQRLDAHPDLVASSERVAFLRDALPGLCRDGGGPLSMASLDAVPRMALRRRRRRYFDAMEAALGSPIGGRVHLDKNPNHTGMLPGLLRLLPESRLIVAIRDPRDVIVSCVLRTFRVSEFSVMLLDWRAAAELYAVEMGAWLRYRAVLDPDMWVVTRYEDGVANGEAEIRRALACLGLPWDPSVARYRERLATAVVHSPTQTEVRQPIHDRAIGRWRAYERWLAPVMPTLRPFIEAFGYPLD